MYSIENNVENTIVIKNSKFITKLYKINNISEIDEIIKKLKDEYNDSTHICYAYIIDNKEKCFDDGEPSGTAGLPILNVLKKKDLTNILAVVIRYFGGIKLGAGGLNHAYSTSIIEALKLTNIIELTYGYLIEINFNYDQVKLIDYMLLNKTVIDKEFSDGITYLFYLNEDETSIISQFEKIVNHISIKNKVLIPKN